jgi:hypothetical protein
MGGDEGRMGMLRCGCDAIRACDLLIERVICLISRWVDETLVGTE